MPVLSTSGRYGSHLAVERRDIFRHSFWNVPQLRGATRVELDVLHRRDDRTTAEWETFVDGVSAGSITEIALDEFETQDDADVAGEVVFTAGAVIVAGTHRLCNRWNTRCATEDAARRGVPLQELDAIGVNPVAPNAPLSDTDHPDGAAIPSVKIHVAEGSRVRLVHRFGDVMKHTPGTVVAMGALYLLVAFEALDGEELDGEAPEDHLLFLPRCRYLWEDEFGDWHHMLQFPVTQAYAVTYHAIQGRTVRRLWWDCTVAPWTHGSAGVVVGRVTAKEDIKICGQLPEDGRMENVVWAEFLDGGATTPVA
jgi:hypothetical protein